ncbi:mitochondrial ornithine transporter 1 [Scaptodrosophila lebanonensis]|uniref:Mitochondrial ornithine transporter 1 n=1 Tax=Drosophila lebanonensis TaxID=7225 RepID=A0A6J2U2Z7_DROLE|nr:mitochondrial ornithine transporter 1 [Scaptodrosophila lebanonensis]
MSSKNIESASTTSESGSIEGPMRKLGASRTANDGGEVGAEAEAPVIGSSKVGSSILIMTPEQILEAYERAIEEAQRRRDSESNEDDDDSELEDDGSSSGGVGGVIGRRRTLNIATFSLLTAFERLCAGLLFVIGKLLRFIRRLDMHGGGTGNNINFVEGLIDFFAGSVGGAAQVYVSQPLDTVKVKLQTFPDVYKGMFDCFVKTYRKDGIFRGLYAGSVPAVFANVAENSVLFAAYGGCQKFVTFLIGKEKAADLTTWENACAGSLAACFSTLTLCPTELIKCKLQALREMQQFVEPGMHNLHTPWTLTQYIWRTEGIRGFYRGLTSTFMREMPGYFFFFGSYEGTRELLRKQNQSKDEIGAVRTMLAGAVGGVCLWTSTFPADVIKSRIQVKNLNASMLSVGADIVRREGFAALYRGLLPSILRTIPATATLFVVYEYTKKALLGTL